METLQKEKVFEPISLLKQENEGISVEYELVPLTENLPILDERRQRIQTEINSLDEMIALNEEKINKLNEEIERLTNHADGLDYMVAVGSGVLTGLLDIIFVGEFSLDNANKWGKEKTNNFVVKVAKMQGYKGDDVKGAIKYLADGKVQNHKNGKGEKIKGWHLASDSVTAEYGGGTQHHLRDFAHHPTIVGLVFSMLTQFTENAYGTDTKGCFQVVPIKNKSFIGKKLPEKFLFGVVYWVFHMISDMAGSGCGDKGGTGIPGPIVSFLKEISSLPIFRNVNKKGNKEFSVWISKLFNGTLLAKRDENGKIIEKQPFDLRTEIGVAHELGKQALPVILNECIVRGFYFVRRLCMEIKEKEIHSFSELKEIDWKKVMPTKNRTIVRMLTIATGTFTAMDLVDAAVRAAPNSVDPATFIANMAVRVNFVGLGRCVVAISTDIKMGVQRSKHRNERIALYSQQIHLLGAKVFYKEADMWIAAESVEKTLEESYVLLEKSVVYFFDSWKEIEEDVKKIDGYIPKIEEKNAGLLQELDDILTW